MKTAFLWKFSILCTKCDSKSPFFQLNENLFSYDNGMQDDFIVRSHIFVCFNFYFAIIVVRHPVGGFPIEIETQISKLITYSLAIFII